MPDKIHSTGDINVFGHIMFDEFEILTLQMCNVGNRAGKQIIHRNHLMPLAQ